MSADRRKQQYMIVGLAGTTIVGALGVIMFVLAPSTNSVAALPAGSGNVETTLIADRTSSAAPEMSWIAQSREQLADLRELVESQSKTMDGLRAEYAKGIKTIRLEYDELLVQQAEKIERLETQSARSTPADPNLRLASLGPATGPHPNSSVAAPDYSSIGTEFVTRTPPAGGNEGPSGPRLGGDNASTARPDALNADPFGMTFELAATPAKEEPDPRLSLRGYVPAGSYATAVVISGADAATNVSDRENPTPILLRVTGQAITAAAGTRRGKVDIRGCTVQGSAIGDLSSERVKVRLLSMTCLNRSGDILETKIKGYVAGSGKAGVRGRVVSREGKVVGNAAIAGVLEGIAGAVGSSGTSTDGDVTAVAGNALSAIGGSGAQSAASTLSEYYINRAEQYQPVVSLYAGTDVEIVFLEGVKIR